MIDTDVVKKNWQSRLLPVMSGMLIGLTIFFFIGGFVLVVFIGIKLDNPDPYKISFDITNDALSNSEDALSLIQWKNLVELEIITVEKKYHQAKLFTMARIWNHYLAFSTGMVLCLVGASFILGKIKEKPTTIKANTDSANVSFVSTSPGLILACLGVIVIVVSIMTHNPIEMEDASTYVNKPVVSVNNRKMVMDQRDELGILNNKITEEANNVIDEL